MANLKYTSSKGTSLLSVAAIVLWAIVASAEKSLLPIIAADHYMVEQPSA